MVGRYMPNSGHGGYHRARVMTIFVFYVGPHFPNIQYFDVCGGIWRYIKLFGGIWRYMEVYGGIWRYISIYKPTFSTLFFFNFLRVWGAFEVRLRCVWGAFEMRLRCVWNAFEMRLRRVWAVWHHQPHRHHQHINRVRALSLQGRYENISIRRWDHIRMYCLVRKTHLGS